VSAVEVPAKRNAAIQILGCRLDLIDADIATEKIFQYVQNSKKGDAGAAQVVTLGTEMVVYAQRDKRFRDIINSSALSLCDTVGLLTVARKRGAELQERVTGVELIEHLCARAAREHVSVFLLGGAEGTAIEAAQKLQVRYPELNIVGIRNGYFSDNESAAVRAEIRASSAQLLFVGLGFPRQEFWIAENLERTGAAVGIGIGGSFDAISGRVRRAPQAWRRLNLEWLYRLLKEPRRWRRQLALPYFVWLTTLERLASRAKSSERSE
jgi:N-acetylglucosaminyldiphosphoundecaprenol N-acetyl-beta-D-mannosaminyltransferase